MGWCDHSAKCNICIRNMKGVIHDVEFDGRSRRMSLFMTITVTVTTYTWVHFSTTGTTNSMEELSVF